MSVSGEARAPLAEASTYQQLLLWAVWATDRRDVPIRRDELAGDAGMIPLTAEQIRQFRDRYFPLTIEAVEKAVASLRRSHDGVMLHYLIDKYFLQWKAIATIAIDEDMSEFHVVSYLQRAIDLVAKRLPYYEQQLAAQRSARSARCT